MMLIQVKNLKKKFAGHEVLKGLSFEIRKGEITAFLGPNGAGKSTTLKTILGLRSPTSGSVEVHGKIGYTSQELSYPVHLKVKEILGFVCAHYNHCFELQELAQKFHLDSIWNRQVGGLSGGEKRRLALASALAGRPDILVLDEPTTGLDLESRQDLWKSMTVFRAGGGTILLSTHDLHEVSQIADQVILIDQGQLLFSGPLKKIFDEIDLEKISYEINGKEETHLTENSDQFIRDLVDHKTDFHNLKIHHASLEEAFLILRNKNKKLKNISSTDGGLL